VDWAASWFVLIIPKGERESFCRKPEEKRKKKERGAAVGAKQRTRKKIFN
jgi:hypothetical protein